MLINKHNSVEVPVANVRSTVNSPPLRFHCYLTEEYKVKCLWINVLSSSNHDLKQEVSPFSRF